MADPHPYGHDFADTRPGDRGQQQNLLHAMRGGVMGGNEYRVMNMPRCWIPQTGAQSVNNVTITAIIWDSPAFVGGYGGWDTDSFYNDVASRTRLTVKTPGIYDVKAHLCFTGSAAGAARLAWVAKNGGTTRYGEDAYTVVAAIASTTYLNVATTMTMNANDYVELWCYQDTGGALATVQDNAPCAYLALTLMSTL